MKDELNGVIMTHFIVLRSKMYSFLTNENKCIKKSKGVKSNVKNSIYYYIIVILDLRILL